MNKSDIQFRNLHKSLAGTWEDFQKPDDIKPESMHFLGYEVKLDDTVYTEVTPEFIDHWNKLVFWKKIKND